MNSPPHEGVTKNHVNELYVFIGINEDGSEDVCSARTQSGWMPLIGADDKRIAALRPLAVDLLRSGAHPTIMITRFTEREDVERVSLDD